MTPFPSSRTPSHSEDTAHCPLPEQVGLPDVSSLSSLSTLWLPPNTLAQTWGQLGAEVPTAPIFFVCALAFQGLASEASALSHYHQGQHPRRGRVRHLLHTARDLVEACRFWDGVVGWLAGRPGHHLPLAEATRVCLAKEAREQVARLWLLQSQVHTELVQVCLEVGQPLPRGREMSFVPSALSVTLVPEERPSESPDTRPAQDDAEASAAATEQERGSTPSPTTFTYSPPASTGESALMNPSRSTSARTTTTAHGLSVNPER